MMNLPVSQCSVGALVLAAGKGTRMKSDLPKALIPLLDQPVLYYILETLKVCAHVARIPSLPTAVIIGHRGESLREYLDSEWPDVTPVWQNEQLGTGHAVQIAKEWWAGLDHLIVLPGDAPLVTAQTIAAALTDHMTSGSDCTFISFKASDPSGYGRVVRDGRRIAVVEEKDASDEQRKSAEVNSGAYVFKVPSLLPHIYRLDNENAQGEYYLPDIISMIAGAGGRVIASLAPDENEFSGINTPLQLAQAANVMARRIRLKHLDSGVRMLDPDSVWIGPLVSISGDVQLDPSVQLWGRTAIARGAHVGSFSILTNAVLEEGASVVSHAVVSDSVIGQRAKVGPFIVVRESTCFDEDSHGGKFVEVKKSRVGKGSKVHHLSYIGDAAIGAGTNIGAGTITCNYDGKRKNPTVIGDNCFIGSDTMLVAPVEIGDEGYTAAGSVITQDVPGGSLAVARARQKIIHGWANKKKEKSDS